jgi:hypothetical protein
MLALYWRRVRLQSIESKSLLGFGLVALLLSWVVMLRNGGDWMPHYRLFLQYGPAWAVVAALVMGIVPFDRRWVAALGLWPILLLGISVVQNHGRILTLTTEVDAFYEESTRRLSRTLGPNDTVSAEAIGYISYHLLSTRFTTRWASTTSTSRATASLQSVSGRRIQPIHWGLLLRRWPSGTPQLTSGMSRKMCCPTIRSVALGGTSAGSRRWYVFALTECSISRPPLQTGRS